MNVRFAVVSAFLAATWLSGPASAETPSVKESPLTRVRGQLMHYDVSPQGTLALLPRLAELARTLKGPDAKEAAFLRAAAATDLYFLAGYLRNEELRAGLATQLGVTPEALKDAIAAELKASAQGVYRSAANQALAELQRTAADGELPVAPFDTARDAAFLRAAASLVADPAVGARFAALSKDPCAGVATCPAAYADFDPEGRRALVYLEQLGLAGARITGAKVSGDPLAEAVAPTAIADFARLRELVLRLPPRLPSDLSVMLPGGSAAWPAPDLIVFVNPPELRYALVPRVRIAESGKVERVPETGTTHPQTATLKLAVPDTSPPTKSIEAFVEAIRATRGESTNFSAALVAEPSVPSQFVARTLVSLRKAGVPNLVLAAKTREGALLGVPLRVVLPTVDGTAATPDLKLRVRLGGYSLDVGKGTIDIPRVRDESGFHFDLAALRNAAVKRAPRSAAVSFMSDVATEQVLLAIFNVTPEKAPVDLVIQ